MRKSCIIAMFVSFCLIISIVAGSIDWGFVGADAQTEESLVEETGEEVLLTEVSGDLEGEFSTEETPEEEVPEETAPTEETPEGEIPEKETPEETAQTEETPEGDVQVEEISEEVIPEEQDPEEEIPEEVPVPVMAANQGIALYAYEPGLEIQNIGVLFDDLAISDVDSAFGDCTVVTPVSSHKGKSQTGEFVWDGKKDVKFQLTISNTGTMDEYFMVTIYSYFVDDEGNRVSAKKPLKMDYNTLTISTGSPEPIGIIVNTVACTQERTTFIANHFLATRDSAVITGVFHIPDDYVVGSEGGYRIDYQIDSVQTHNAVDAIRSSWGMAVKFDDNGRLELEYGGLPVFFFFSDYDNISAILHDRGAVKDLIVRKVDGDTGEPVRGSTFGLYSDPECKSLIAKSSDDSTGISSFMNLAAPELYSYGSVYLKELSCYRVYKLDESAHKIDVTYANGDYSFRFNDLEVDEDGYVIFPNERNNIIVEFPVVSKMVTDHPDDLWLKSGDKVRFQIDVQVPDTIVDYDEYTFRFYDRWSPGFIYVFGEDNITYKLIRSDGEVIDLSLVYDDYGNPFGFTDSHMDMTFISPIYPEGWLMASEPHSRAGGMPSLYGEFARPGDTLRLTYDLVFVPSNTKGAANSLTSTYSASPFSAQMGESRQTVRVQTMNLLINKMSDTKEPLYGAAFELYEETDSGWTKLCDLETVNNMNKYALPSGITLGGSSVLLDDGSAQYKDTRYKLVETTAPDGYEVTEPIIFTISPDQNIVFENGLEYSIMNNTLLFTVTDYPEKSENINLQVIKCNSEREQLTGASFSLYNQTDMSLVKQYESDDTQSVFLFEELGVGSYVLRELTSPDGYTGSEDIVFEVTDDNRIVSTSDYVLELSNDESQGVWSMSVVNYTGARMPLTGGTGTMFLYLFGFTAFVAVLFITGIAIRKKENNKH